MQCALNGGAMRQRIVFKEAGVVFDVGFKAAIHVAERNGLADRYVTVVDRARGIGTGAGGERVSKSRQPCEHLVYGRG